MEDEIKVLLEIPDKLIAEEIQRILEESGIYSMLESDNPASSLMGIYAGPNVIENISIKINVKDYDNAVAIIGKTAYTDLLSNE